jgi:hypothetical protein
MFSEAMAGAPKQTAAATKPTSDFLVNRLSCFGVA